MDNYFQIFFLIFRTTILTNSITTKCLISAINLVDNNRPNGADQCCNQNQIIEKLVNAVTTVIETIFRLDNHFRQVTPDFDIFSMIKMNTTIARFWKSWPTNDTQQCNTCDSCMNTAFKWFINLCDLKIKYLFKKKIRETVRN